LKEKINQITSSQSQLTVENDQLKAQLARLSTADARRQELEQILSSRSHRLATAVSSLRGRLIRKRHGKNPVI